MTSEPDESLLTLPGQWQISYNYAAGRTASRFFLALKNEAKIMATTCRGCERTLVPPRSHCERCFRPVDAWCEVGPEGSVVAFTVSFRPNPVIDRTPPFVIAMIRLDGADTNLIHVVEGCGSDPEAIIERVRAGLRVRARFRDKEAREGHILDIASFDTIE